MGLDSAASFIHPPARPSDHIAVENNLKLPPQKLDRPTLELADPYVASLEQTLRAYNTLHDQVAAPPSDSTSPTDIETREYMRSLQSAGNAIRTYQRDIPVRATEVFNSSRTWSPADVNRMRHPSPEANLSPSVFVGEGTQPRFLPETLAALGVIKPDQVADFYGSRLWREGIWKPMAERGRDADHRISFPEKFQVPLQELDRTIWFTVEPDLARTVDKIKVSLSVDPFSNVNDGASSKTTPDMRRKATDYAIGLGVGQAHPSLGPSHRVTSSDLLR